MQGNIRNLFLRMDNLGKIWPCEIKLNQTMVTYWTSERVSERKLD